MKTFKPTRAGTYKYRRYKPHPRCLHSDIYWYDAKEETIVDQNNLKVYLKLNIKYEDGIVYRAPPRN